jgi:hypothetical protein
LATQDYDVIFILLKNKNMKKFEKVVIWNEETNVGPLLVIGGKIDSRISGDWSEYDEYEEVRYRFNLNDEDEMCEFEDSNMSIEDIREFVGDGICIEVVEDDRIWYNVSIEDNMLYVDWINLEI